MMPSVAPYVSPEERREKNRQRRAEFAAAFAPRLREATERFRDQNGRHFTHRELAAMLRERTGKRCTPRAVGLWYRGKASPRYIEHTLALADLFGVRVGWLGFGEGSPQTEAVEPGVYESGGGSFQLWGRSQRIVATVSVEPDAADRQRTAVVRLCYELLDLLDPETPQLRVVR